MRHGRRTGGREGQERTRECGLSLLPAWRLSSIVRRALDEDLGSGDLTSWSVVPPASRAEGAIVAKETGVIAGLEPARLAFAEVDPGVRWQAKAADGERVDPGQEVARVSGQARSLLAAERVALNFLQQLSGVATLTRRFVDACAGTRTQVLDTRKTVPGLRELQRYAVRVGGGTNHRFGLFDAVLIKENHIALAGGITQALASARARLGPMVEVEIEVERLDQLEEALAAGAEHILLDNMDPATLREAVRLTAGRARLEASGGIRLEQVAEIARTGVDFISVGALTHSAPALDLSLRLSGVTG